MFGIGFGIGSQKRHTLIRLFLAIGLLSGVGTTVSGQEAIEITEIFSNTDGSVQYVELTTRSSFQTELEPMAIVGLNSNGTVQETFFDFVGSFDAIGDPGTPFLVATPGFEAAFGFAPDFVATGSLMSPSGRVVFLHDTSCFGCCNDIEVDALAYGEFTGDNSCFGSPAPFLPNDGCLSLSRVNVSDDNSEAWEVTLPSPRRADGAMGFSAPDLCQPILSSAETQMVMAFSTAFRMRSTFSSSGF